MKVKKAIELLQSKKPTAQVYWNEFIDEQYGLLQIENREKENKVVLSNLSNVNGNCNDYKPIISVETLLTCLKNFQTMLMLLWQQEIRYFLLSVMENILIVLFLKTGMHLLQNWKHFLRLLQKSNGMSWISLWIY